jgi:hypothetical protein
MGLTGQDLVASFDVEAVRACLSELRDEMSAAGAQSSIFAKLENLEGYNYLVTCIPLETSHTYTRFASACIIAKRPHHHY